MASSNRIHTDIQIAIFICQHGTAAVSIDLRLLIKAAARPGW